MSELDEYRDAVWEKWRREAVWPPGADLEPGMVGSIDLGAFTYEGLLSDFGIDYSVRRDRNGTDEELQSKEGITIKAKAAGEADTAFPNVPAAKAAFRADFSRAKSFVFRAIGARYYRLDKQHQVWRAVKAAMDGGQMPSDYVVVSEVAVADGGLVAISNDRNAHVELTGDAEVGKTLDFDASVEFSSHEKIFQKVAGERLSILYLLLRPVAGSQSLGTEGEPELEEVRATEVRLPEDLERRFTYVGGNAVPDDGGGGGYAGHNDPNTDSVYDSRANP